MRSPDPEPPEFFLDRGLNGVAIARQLRAAGFRCVTMDEMYGEEDAKRIGDERWMREATELGLVLLHKDKAIRRRECEAVRDNKTRNFALANGQIRGDEIVRWYVNNLPRIVAAYHRRKPPYFYHVHADKVVPMKLYYPRGQ